MRRFWIFWFPFASALTAVGGATLFVASLPAKPFETQVTHAVPLTGSLESKARFVLAENCGTCHTRGRSGADFDDPTLSVTVMRRDRAIWELAVKKLRSGQMPPRDFPQPPAEYRESLINWIEQEVLGGAPEPTGPVMARRLQRSEYFHAVRDLFGMPLHPPSELPVDDTGWDQCATVPALAQADRDQYRAAAESVLDEALAEELASIAPSFCAPDDHGQPSDNLAAKTPRLFVLDRNGKTENEHARAILASFAHKAYRRPVDADETEQLVAAFERAVKDGAGFEDSLRAALTEVLTSPHFLFQIETRKTAEAVSDQHQLAARLSFFLWSSTPDDELLALADQGVLTHHLERQVHRMLKDARSSALTTNFAAHWLSLGKLEVTPGLDPTLARAMRRETELFCESIVREDRSVLEFVDADYTFLNEPLAKHYAIPGIRGDELRRVSLHGTLRGGLLTHASILTITSMDQRGVTSPVNRGKWVLENVLGSPPIRPSPEALEALKNTRKVFEPGAVKQQMQQHRENPGCASCHVRMDAIGLSLENFDGFGAWRTQISSVPVDASGILPDGETLNGHADLKAYLVRHREDFVRGLRAKLLSYALARKLDDRDRAALDRIPAGAAGEPMPFSRVILEVVQSEAFQMGWREPDAGER